MQRRKVVLARTEHAETVRAAQGEAMHLAKLVRLKLLSPEEALALLEIGPRERAVLTHFFGSDFAGREILAAASSFRELVRAEFFELVKTIMAKQGGTNGHGHGGPTEKLPAGA